MGHRTTRPPGRIKKAPQRPSAFFIIAMLIGLLILAWIFAQATARPVKPKTSTLDVPFVSAFA